MGGRTIDCHHTVPGSCSYGLVNVAHHPHARALSYQKTLLVYGLYLTMKLCQFVGIILP